ncbi:hypothetical protein Tco_0502397 [Tanacetum coccineum]
MIIAEDQPYVDYASPTALSSWYIVDSNQGEDPEEDPADEGDNSDDDESSDDDDDDDDSSDDDKEEEEEDKEEEHTAPADSSAIHVVDLVPLAEDTEVFESNESAPTPVPSPRRHTARMSVRPQTPIPLPSEVEVERLLALPIPPPSPLTPLPSPLPSPLPQIPSPPLPVSSPPLPLPPSTVDSPTYAEAPLGYRAAGIRMRASSPPVPTPSPLPSPPLQPLPAPLSIPPPVDHREDIPEAKFPPHKRLCLTTPTPRFEVGESSTAAPTRGRRSDYRFISTMNAEIRRQRAERVGYGIRDVWVDPTEAVDVVAPTTLEGVNARVTELDAVQELDSQDVHAVIEDAQDRQTQLSQRVDVLGEDRLFHYETARLLDQEALCNTPKNQVAAEW